MNLVLFSSPFSIVFISGIILLIISIFIKKIKIISLILACFCLLISIISTLILQGTLEEIFLYSLIYLFISFFTLGGRTK